MTRYTYCRHCWKKIWFWQRYEVIDFDSCYGEFFIDICVHKGCYGEYRKKNPKKNTSEQWVLDEEKKFF